MPLMSLAFSPASSSASSREFGPLLDGESTRPRVLAFVLVFGKSDYGCVASQSHVTTPRSFPEEGPMIDCAPHCSNGMLPP